MELILISAGKMKVMLSQSELEKYNIDGGDISCSDTSTRRAIRSILDKVTEQTGFDTSGNGIFVQFFSSPKGGCEIFITRHPYEQNGKACDTRTRERESKRHSTSYERAMVSIYDTQKSEQGQFGKLCFSFPDLDGLSAVCRRLYRLGFNSQSQAYTDADGIFYLVLDNVGMSAYSRLDKYTFILEYGQRESADSLPLYIGEHGRIICERDAVAKIGSVY